MEGIASKLVESAEMSRLYPELDEWSLLKLTCRRDDYSASILTRAIEDCDAHVVNLNVTSETVGDNDDPVIEVRLTRATMASVERSLARYGYDVLVSRSSSDNATDDDTLVDRFNHLMRYLEV